MTTWNAERVMRRGWKDGRIDESLDNNGQRGEGRKEGE